MTAAELKLAKAKQEVEHDAKNVALYKKTSDPRLKQAEARLALSKAHLEKLQAKPAK